VEDYLSCAGRYAATSFEDAIRAELVAVPTTPATVIAQRVGWTRGMTVFNERVRELRPAYLPPDPAGRTAYDAGDIAQCDLWFRPHRVGIGVEKLVDVPPIRGHDRHRVGLPSTDPRTQRHRRPREAHRITDHCKAVCRGHGRPPPSTSWMRRCSTVASSRSSNASICSAVYASPLARPCRPVSEPRLAARISPASDATVG
jgi:hypothetical protein